jgi:hypothetical protein
MTVNWLSIEIVNAAGKITYRNSFVTDLPVDRDNVAELAACGRPSVRPLRRPHLHLARFTSGRCSSPPLPPRAKLRTAGGP